MQQGFDMKMISYALGIIFFYASHSSFVVAEPLSKDPKDTPDILVGDGNTKWILDKEYLSDHLGNDPDNNCVKVYQFNPQGKVKESCLEDAKTQTDNGQTKHWESPSQKTITIDGKAFKVVIRPDGCLMSLSDETSQNMVFRRVPQPSSGCKD